ncbi:hypothetical protein M408DRAFT_333799 [Serendipita vermifera MAFF 305830]|uniref:Uncharacterized protein n=1 Tax=Serendipita vermifera MAFF 305830 TaxID=933852 RepID=A0A0C3AL76_SERVB|nr:hypothetical protein M408DRAFT_333799 [Serendipita vermifera MAFF 305830]
MDASEVFPFTDEDLDKAGLLGEGVDPLAQQVIETMKAHPKLLKLSIFVLQCINHVGQSKSPDSSFSSTTSSDPSNLSNLILTTTSQGSNSTLASPYAVSDYEKAVYYRGITADGDQPDLLYRSDITTNPFPSRQPPTRGNFGHLPSKSIRDVYNTSLHKVWRTVGPQIRDLVKAQKVRYSSIDPVRFVSYGEDKKETLGPPIVWIAVPPNSTSPETAHNVTQAILAILGENKAEDVVVEWREAVLSKLSGPPLMPVVNSINPTAHLRRIFTPALNIPLATKEREAEDTQGSLTMFFHENKDKNGNPSNKVLGVSNCHVLRADTSRDYVFRGGGAARQVVRVNGTRRFQQGLEEIMSILRTRSKRANTYTREIAELEAQGNLSDDDNKTLHTARQLLTIEQGGIAKLERFFAEVKNHWSDIEARNIGHLRVAKAIRAIPVDVAADTCYTEDWGAFEIDEMKVKAEFEGTFVDLGTAVSSEQVKENFYPRNDSRTTFKYPKERKFRIEGVVPRELIDHPDLLDSENRSCLIVGKDGTATGLTFGRYLGLESYVCSDLGVETMELGIYNLKEDGPVFSDKGDSGALIWDGNGRALGQLHSGHYKSLSSRSHVTYATPAWWLLERIKLEFPHAVFFRNTWSV